MGGLAVPDKASQDEEIWRAQAELQRHGFSRRCESVVIFGVSTVSLCGIDKKAFRRRLGEGKSVWGQTQTGSK